MDFNVAGEDTIYTVHDWLGAWGEADNGIPRTFVVDGQGGWRGSGNLATSILFYKK
jgi:hypothetical protein